MLIIVILAICILPFHFQLSCDDEVSLSQLRVPLLSGYNKLYLEESDALYSASTSNNVVYSASTSDLQSYYLPLKEPDLRDLPSFAYQISQGMVSAAKCVIYTGF